MLDIGCGKGGDLQKWKRGGIGHLIGTDIAETSLSQCRDRYTYMCKQQRDRCYTANFFPADSTKVINELRLEASPNSLIISVPLCWNPIFSYISPAFMNQNYIYLYNAYFFIFFFRPLT